jgi:ABC-2 type transport system ATP-binding protein
VQPTPIAECVGVSKVFRPAPVPWARFLGGRGEREIVALRGVDLTIGQDEIVGLAGPNGAGKTVLVKLLATLTEPTAGSVRLFGLDARGHGRAVSARIGMTTADERSFYWRLTPRQNLRFFAKLHGLGGAPGNRRVDELLDRLQLLPLADRPFRMLSAGNRHRLAIARALLADPDLLLLDEPTANLDPIAARNLRELIKERARGSDHRSILITTHNLAELEELCDRVGILSQGRMLECADFPTLRARYGGQDRVRVVVQQLDEGLRARIGGRVPGLAIADLGERGVELVFEEPVGGAHLAFVLGELGRTGAAVRSCTTRSPTLQDVFLNLIGSAESP